MKSSWLSAVVLAVSLAVSACGPTDETQEQEGNVEQLLPQCDENGVCPEGFYCVSGPFGVCKRGIEPLLYPCTDDGRCPKGTTVTAAPAAASSPSSSSGSARA